MSNARRKDEDWAARAVRNCVARVEVACYARVLGRKRFDDLCPLAIALLEQAADAHQLMSLDEAFKIAETVKVTGG